MKLIGFFVGAVLLFVIIWAFVFWWRKPKFTRERFVFFAGSTLAGLTVILVMQLVSEFSVASLVLHAIFGLFYALESGSFTGIDALQLRKPSSLETAISLIAIGGLALWFYKIFISWNGPKSIAQIEQEQNGIKPDPSRDFGLFLSLRADSRAKLAPFIPVLDNAGRHMLAAPELIAWHVRAKSLWKLRRPNVAFEDQFDRELKCWIGKDTATAAVVCLICTLSDPSEEHVQKVRNYLRKVRDAHRPGAPIEIVVACKLTCGSCKHKDIATFAEQELLDDLIDFSEYFGHIERVFIIDNLQNSELSLADMYVPPRCKRLSDQAGLVMDLSAVLDAWMQETSSRHVALLGEYGQGKSTASIALAFRLIEQLRQGVQVRVPVIVELRGKSPRSLNPEELLAVWAQRFGIDPRALLQLHLSGKILLIFEGFDEMDLTGDSDARISHFRQLWQFAVPGSKILITGRPNYFLDDSEQKISLGIESPSGTRPYCEAFHLEPLSLEEIGSCLRNADFSTKSEILELAGRDPYFREIAAKPSMLQLIYSLWRKEEISKYSGRITKALIMRLFVKHSYRRQGVKASERSFMALNSAEREYFMQGIAGFMLAKKLPNQISAAHLNQAIAALLGCIPDSVSTSVGAMSGELREPLRSSNRFDWAGRHKDAIEHLQTDVRACGIIVSDLSKEGHFRFSHKSTMEFLQAELLWKLAEKDATKVNTYASIVATLGLQINQFFSHKEVLEFFKEIVLDAEQKRGSAEARSIELRLFETLAFGNLGSNQAPALLTRLVLSTYVFHLNFWAFWFRPFLKKPLAGLPNNQRKLDGLFHLSFGYTVFGLAFAPAFAINLIGDFNTGKLVYIDLYIFSILIVVLLARRLSATVGLINRFRIWYGLGRALGIDDRTLARIAGKPLINHLRATTNENNHSQ